MRSTVEPESQYSKYRQVLRKDFCFSCAYCAIAECEAAGITFEIEHYLPQSRYPELANEYGNLMWSCEHCNSRKRSHPTEAACSRGCRFYRPDFDDPETHFETRAANHRFIDSRTADVGEYTIQQLDLNRRSLRELRDLRQRLAESTRVIAHGLNVLANVRIDTLPKGLRLRFQQIRKELNESSEVVTKQMIGAINKSPLLATEDESPSPARRAYLKKINAPI